MRRRTFLKLAPLAVVACGERLFTPLPPIPGPLRRGPQVAQVGTTTAIVAWRTDTAGRGALEYGPAPVPATRVDGTVAEEQVFQLTGLAPGTTYAYRPLFDGQVLGDHAFRTAPADPAALVRIAVLGDSGSGEGAQLDLAARLRDWAPDLVLHTGDVIYERGDPWELDPKYFLPYREVVDRAPVYPCLGNHDTYFDGGKSLLDALHLPVNPVTGTEEYYSFDRGDLHVAVLNSNNDLGAGSAQRAWLASDLAASPARWKLAVLHHPPYSSGPQGNEAALRAAVCPVFEQHGVDVVFTGHDHLYSRTFPIVDEAPAGAAQEPDYVDPAGPVYVVTGGGGKSLYTSTARPFIAFHESAYHYVRLEIEGSRLTLAAVRLDGTEMDRMTIAKS